MLPRSIRILLALVLGLAVLAPAAAVAREAAPLFEVAPALWQTVPTDPQVRPPAIDLWNMLILALVPLAVAFVTGQAWPDWQKVLVQIAVSTIVVIGGMFWRGELEGIDSTREVAENLMWAIVLVIGWYYGVWKPIGATGAIHRATG